MCTGACILYGISRVVIGENKTFLGGEAYLKQRGIEVVVMENEECQDLMELFIKEKPEVWYVEPARMGYPRLTVSTGTRTLARNSEFTRRSRIETMCNDNRAKCASKVCFIVERASFASESMDFTEVELQSIWFYTRCNS